MSQKQRGPEVSPGTGDLEAAAEFRAWVLEFRTWKTAVLHAFSHQAHTGCFGALAVFSFLAHYYAGPWALHCSLSLSSCFCWRWSLSPPRAGRPPRLPVREPGLELRGGREGRQEDRRRGRRRTAGRSRARRPSATPGRPHGGLFRHRGRLGARTRRCAAAPPRAAPAVRRAIAAVGGQRRRGRRLRKTAARC